MPAEPGDGLPPARAASWSAAWSALGAQGDGATARAALWAAYGEPQRRYHGRQHLLECLTLLEAFRDQAPEPEALTLALWFHDAIYEPRPGAANEVRSADWARRELLGAGAPAARAEQLRRLVLATRHAALPQQEDEAWLVDIDLAILGAAPARFAEYEAQIRAEYGFVPEPLFRAKRAEILRGFLERPTIYTTRALRERFELCARRNLQAALQSLG